MSPALHTPEKPGGVIMRKVPCALVAVSLTLLGCSSATKIAKHDPGSQSSVVIEPEDLAHRLASGERPVLLDARSLEDYGPAHAVGAQRVDMREWSAASRRGEGLNDTEAWSIRIGALGIDESTPVIIYDDGGMTSAARAWFILRECGVRNVRVVNGGWSNLCPVLEPRLVQAGNPGDFTPTRFAAAAPDNVATKEQLRLIAEARSQPILDVRTEDEFTGNIKVEPGRPTPRAGHIPGATNLPHKQMLDDRGRLKSPTELKAIFASANSSSEQPTVILCQSGGRAAFAALAAEHAGIENTTVYYMSMGEWYADADCPVETGTVPSRKPQ